MKCNVKESWKTITGLSHHGEGCPVLGFLSCRFHVLFWKVTLLSFQVTCRSSCVSGLMSPLIPDCFHLHSFPDVYIVCVFPCLVARVFRLVVYLQLCFLQPCWVIDKYCYAWFLFHLLTSEEVWRVILTCKIFGQLAVLLLVSFCFTVFLFSPFWSTLICRFL